MHIGDWLTRREMLSPDNVALVDTLHEGRPITYREWNRAANRTAHFLRTRLGVQRGDRVAVLAMNCVEYLDTWFACGKLGAILQVLNWRLKAPELAALIEDAAPRVLIYGPDFREQVDALRAQPTSIRHFVAFDAGPDAASELALRRTSGAVQVSPRPNPLQEAGGVGSLSKEPALSLSKGRLTDVPFGERERHPDSPPPEVDLIWDDAWVLCYTGGTTGLPKAAILTHGSVTWNSINTVMSWGLTPDDVAVLNAPLFHAGGLNVFTMPLVHIGGTSIVCRSFDVDQVFDLIRDAGVTLYFGVPTMFIAMQQHPRWPEADFSRLKLVISGGAPCPMPVFERFWARGVDFKTGYGLTEAGPNTFWLPPADVRLKPGSVGFPLFHVDVKIVDAAGRECDPDEVGELLIRGPHVCAGYWNQPEETAKTIVGGWLHSGDLARRDAEGYYYIIGRLKDMIISGGENIYPAEVESVMHAHPAVAEAALIGVPHEKWGEVGRAIVVARPAATLTEPELLGFVRQRLANYKVPKSVVFVDQLPKTGANKVDKKALVEKYGE